MTVLPKLGEIRDPTKPRSTTVEGIFFYLGMLLFKCALDLASYFLVNNIPLNRFTFRLAYNGDKLMESYLLLMIIAVVSPKSAKSVSTVLVWLLLLISYVPLLTVYAMADEQRSWVYAVSLFWFVLLLLLRLPVRWHPPKPLTIAPYLTGAITVLVNGYSIAAILLLGVSVTLDLNGVYDIRSDYYSAHVPMLEYAFNWSAFVVNPILFVTTLRNNRYVMASLIAFLELLLFSKTGNKIYLLAIPLVYGLVWLYWKRKLTFHALAFGLSALVASGIVSFYWLGDVWLSALFINRLLVLPALISFNYFDFFSQHPFAYLSHSLLSPFIRYPYPFPPQFLIGQNYFADASVAANTGMVGDAYMNFGYAGMAGLVLLVFVAFKVIDNTASLKEYWLAMATLVMPLLFSVNGGFLTSILTGGLGLAMLILYLLPRTGERVPES